MTDGREEGRKVKEGSHGRKVKKGTVKESTSSKENEGSKVKEETLNEES